MGCDIKRQTQTSVCNGFNPRTHMGCDKHSHKKMWEFLSSFNPRTHMGCDVLQTFFDLATYCFNPRTHMGCDYMYVIHVMANHSFNPRTHMGCDRKVRGVRTAVASFNPRTHMGCDGKVHHYPLLLQKFQSTHPHGVRRVALMPSDILV